ncbi:MAG: TetR/AcrR family transcriptional regulator [Lachnospiraceae bacterium]|nr:TetR/AcrR family transcriptional regulator [Lachnospiraceae bacterium]
MGKLEEKKKQKKEALLQAAFSLFTTKGIEDTSISEIVREAGMAKGTFYLYFKDKYDLRDKLIVHKATGLFRQAVEQMMLEKLPELEDKVIFLADFIINHFHKNPIVLRFIARNLSWGVFQHMLVSETEDSSGYRFYDAYGALLKESGRSFRNPDLMLYMIVELINSTCHNVILMEEPVTLDVLKPELYGVIRDIIRRMEND